MKRPIPIHPSIVFVVLTLLVAPSAFLQHKNLPLLLFVAMCISFCLTFAWSKLVIRNIEVRRIIQGPAHAREPYVIRYVVKNTSKFLAGFSVWIEERDTKKSTWQHAFRHARGWIMEVGSKESVHGESIFYPMQRGEYSFEAIRVSTSFPFGMLKSTRTIVQHASILVHPHVEQLKPDVIAAVISEGPLGRRSKRSGRGGDDFFGLKEFTSGDRLVDIAWKSSAKRGELVCVQRSISAPPRIRIILDLTTPTEELESENDKRLLEEQAISLCASLLTEASLQGHEIGLTILGVTESCNAGMHSGARHLGKLCSSLAKIQLDEERLAMPSRLGLNVTHAGLIVIRPDKTQPIPQAKDAWYFVSSQFDRLKRSSRKEAVA
ncbi:MAG: DUF58 domain-containing protein [Planctomycetota bacterium]|nr:DUF58 domain-containing protein [Planctomycetota bacterium]